MALRRIPLPPLKRTEQPTAHFPLDLDAYRDRAEQQKTLALEMIRRVQEMCILAAEMRKPPRLTFP